MNDPIPCPFCGGKAAIFSKNEWNHPKNMQDIWAHVECPKCEFEGPSFASADVSGVGEAWEPNAPLVAAVEHWNKRPAPKEVIPLHILDTFIASALRELGQDVFMVYPEERLSYLKDIMLLLVELRAKAKQA